MAILLSKKGGIEMPPQFMVHARRHDGPNGRHLLGGTPRRAAVYLRERSSAPPPVHVPLRRRGQQRSLRARVPARAWPVTSAPGGCMSARCLTMEQPAPAGNRLRCWPSPDSCVLCACVDCQNQELICRSVLFVDDLRRLKCGAKARLPDPPHVRELSHPVTPGVLR